MNEAERTRIIDIIARYETHIHNMNKALITPSHRRLGRLQSASRREFAVMIRTLYEDALGERITGIAREVLYNPKKLDAELAEAV